MPGAPFLQQFLVCSGLPAIPERWKEQEPRVRIELVHLIYVLSP